MHRMQRRHGDPGSLVVRARAAQLRRRRKAAAVVNTTDAAIDAAVAGQGLTCVLSYQVDVHVAAGRLQHVLLEYEPPPISIHVLHPAGRYLSTKVRLFIDDAIAALRQKFGVHERRR